MIPITDRLAALWRVLVDRFDDLAEVMKGAYDLRNVEGSA